MKPKIFYLVIVCTILISSCTPGPKSPGPGINYFKGSFDEALQEANKQSKPVFIYGYTDWCGYCTKMNKSTFKEKEVDDYMNTNYINLSYDMEKGEGTFVAGKYGLRSYPAYVLLNKDGELMAITFGYMRADKFMSWVKNKP